MKTLGVIIGGIALISLFMVIGLTRHAHAIDKEFRKCAGCHQIKEGKKGGMGPNLWGVFGREAGQAEGYRYSEYLKNSGIVWTREALQAWLSNRKTRQAYFGKEVNDTKMMWNGIKKEADMTAILDYLETKK
tara:strand:- start:993 stop:1388 length:396 start_codon:yes stop_codon:yes gene_type:complete